MTTDQAKAFAMVALSGPYNMAGTVMCTKAEENNLIF
jgi:hypothetical protein